MGLSIKQRLALLPAEDRMAFIEEQPQDVLVEMFKEEWWYVARPEQIPPEGDWLICLALAGRGWGKSRAGAEWLVEQVNKHPYDRSGVGTEWLVIAETLSDARLICLEGPSGILNVLRRRGIQYKYAKSPKPMIFIGDARIHTLSAEDEDVGRGFNAAGAWMDEMAKWLTPKESWIQGIMPSLRADLLGDHPRAFVTTTPKPVDPLPEWLERRDGSVHVISGATFDNSVNLSKHVLRELKLRYAGTAIGEQELYGKLLELQGGGLFKRMNFVNNRVKEAPEGAVSTVVGMDPNLTGEDDETGIVVVCRTADNHMYVLADNSVPQAGRTAAMAAWNTVAVYGADLLVYEENLGKAWMKQVLEDAYKECVTNGLFPPNTTPSMRGTHSKVGKKTRAEPVNMRNEQGTLHMVGEFEELEKQCILFDPTSTRESPDRMDAMVHACLELMSGERRQMALSAPDRNDIDLLLSDPFSIVQNID